MFYVLSFKFYRSCNRGFTHNNHRTSWQWRLGNHWRQSLSLSFADWP